MNNTPAPRTPAEILKLERELVEANEQIADNERWMREVLTDFRIPFDDHLIGRRLALAQWMADKLKGTL